MCVWGGGGCVRVLVFEKYLSLDAIVCDLQLCVNLFQI